MKRLTIYALTTILASASSLAYADDSISSGMASAGQSVSNAMSTAGQSVGHGMAVTGRAIDDSTITTIIKSKYLADTDLNVFKIKVATTKGVVTLKGQVSDQAQYQKAVDIAKNIKGVTGVNADSLKVITPNSKAGS